MHLLCKSLRHVYEIIKDRRRVPLISKSTQSAAGAAAALMALAVRTFDPSSVTELVNKSLVTPAAGVLADSAFVCVGDVIDTDEEGFLRGHGTQVVDGRLVATVCGVVERINKLVYVRALKSRYVAELGDVVVGRITEIAGRRWKVDLRSRQEASLQVSAANLPGGVQRRRNAEDELNMRTVFREGDLISAEVQLVNAHDGSVALHTRSLKYGKLLGGCLVDVPSNLIKRQRQHFHTLEGAGVDVIVGLNGLVWVSPHQPRGEDGAPLHGGAPPPPSLEARDACTRVANAIRVLARLSQQVYPATILDTYELSLNPLVPPRDMLEVPFLGLTAQSEAVRRHVAAVAGEAER